MAQASPVILVVDDEEYVRESLPEVLNDVGLQCVTASGADDAVAALQREEFDLVLLDINMPGRSGMDLLPEIRTEYPDVAVVMLSGVQDLSVGVEAMRLGAYDYITKPVSMPDLTLRVEKALSQRDLLLANVEYQELLEAMLVELTEAFEIQQRQLSALTKLLKTDIGQGTNLSPASIRLHTARAGFESVLEKLTKLTSIGGGPEASIASPNLRNSRKRWLQWRYQ